MQERAPTSKSRTKTAAKPAKARTASLKDVKLDPVDHAVISQALIAAGREMGTKMIRSSYSNIVREAQDASAALFDRHGNEVSVTTQTCEQAVPEGLANTLASLGQPQAESVLLEEGTLASSWVRLRTSASIARSAGSARRSRSSTT